MKCSFCQVDAGKPLTSQLDKPPPLISSVSRRQAKTGTVCAILFNAPSPYHFSGSERFAFLRAAASQIDLSRPTMLVVPFGFPRTRTDFLSPGLPILSDGLRATISFIPRWPRHCQRLYTLSKWSHHVSQVNPNYSSEDSARKAGPIIDAAPLSESLRLARLSGVARRYSHAFVQL
jgi:hypothetical protein